MAHFRNKVVRLGIENLVFHDISNDFFYERKQILRSFGKNIQLHVYKANSYLTRLVNFKLLIAFVKFISHIE